MILLKLLFPLMGLAFIPKASTIVQKVVENNGSGTYLIEQEVQFPSTQEPFILKESWLIENENKMRLVVTGVKELKDRLRWVFVYENGNRYQLLPSGRTTKTIDDDFIEKYFHFRKVESLQAALVRMKIVPSSMFAKHPFHAGHDPDYQTDPHLHLARVGGVITYAFGLPAESRSQLTPEFFIEQDQFVLRKFRLPSTAEVNADHQSIFAHGFLFPRTRSVKWNDHQVIMQTIHVQPRAEKNLKLNLEASTSTDFPEFGSAKGSIEEFYKRFR